MQAERRSAGTVALNGFDIDPATPSASLRRGLAFLSEDRRSQGICAGLSVRENLTASVLGQLSRFGVVSRRQQDTLVARCLCGDPVAVMLDDPRH